MGGSGSISFDASVLTLQGYTQKIGGSWVVEFSGNSFVFYDNAMNSPIDSKKVIFTATFKVNSNVAEGTADAVDAAWAAIKDGSLKVFDTSKFTVGGETVTSAFALDTDADWVNDTAEAIIDGAFVESYHRSAPYFGLRIDGITELN